MVPYTLETWVESFVLPEAAQPYQYFLSSSIHKSSFASHTILYVLTVTVGVADALCEARVVEQAKL